MSNYCILNGIYSNELTGLLVSSLPPISKPLMRTQIETIDGRDGDIVTNLGYSAYDKQMEIGLYGDYDIDEIIAFFASEGTVTFSNEPDKYYHYTIVDQIDFERLIRYRKATVTFHVQPYKYDATETEIDFTNTFTEDTEPYIFRANQHDANMMKLKKVVGGTIAWIQLVQNGNFESTSGWSRVNGSLSANNNELTYTLTAVGQYGYENQIAQTLAENMVSGHKYLFSFDCYGSKAMTLTLWLNVVGNNTWYQVPYSTANAWGSIATVVSASSVKNQIAIAFNAVMNSLAVGDVIKVRNVMVIDLTQMFGSTIADYIYSLEQAHAGDGVAWFKALFGEDYYPYNSGELLSVKTSARKTYNADNVEIGSYPLDDDLELRGIPKLDGNNELYYDGDTYASDGTVTRKWGYIEVDGSEDENWILGLSGPRYAFRYNLPYTTTAYTNVLTNRIEVNSTNQDYENGGRVSCRGTQYASTYFYIFTPPSVASTLTEFKAWLSANPVQLIYALTQSEYTESADAYTQSQRVGATEEFVDGRTVEIPVGNNTLYYDGTPEIVVTNTGNAISKPILTIYGSGDITVSLNSNQIFSIALGDYEYITIDTNAMEAYMGGVLLNRLVTGDYADFSLAVGDNTLSFTGNVSEVLIENYSRWI